MDEHLSAIFRATGKYFLQTHSNLFNLAQGMDGVRFYKVTPTRLQTPNTESTVLDDTVPEHVLDNVFF